MNRGGRSRRQDQEARTETWGTIFRIVFPAPAPASCCRPIALIPLELCIK